MSVVKLGFTASDIIKAGRITKEEIDHINAWIATQNLPKITDEQIILFLLSCCRNDKETKATISAFYSVRKSTPELFSNRRVSRIELQKQLSTLKFCVFPKRTDDGNVIMYQALQDFDYKNYEMESAFKLIFMTLETTFYDNPPEGLIIIYDMEGVTLRHLMKSRINLIASYCKYLQECLQVRLKCAHILNAMGIFHKMMVMLKPFLSDRVKDALHTHLPGTDMDLFAKQYIPKSHLPKDLGGYLPSTQVLHQKNIEKLIEMEPYFDAEELQRREWLS